MKKLLFCFTLYVALIGGSYMLYHLVLPIRVSFHLLASGVLVAYLYKRGLPNNPLTLGAGLMLIPLGLSITGAVDQRMALENGWSWLVNLLLLLALIQLFRDGHRDTLFKAHYWAGAFVAVVVLGEFALTGSRPGGWFNNITLTGAYTAALIIPVFHAGWEEKGRKRYWYLLLMSALGATVLTTESRGGLLSAGVAVGVYITLLQGGGLKLKAVVWLLGATVVVGGLILFLSTRPNHSDGDIERMGLWRAAAQMIEGYPSGTGPGLFAQVYRQIGNGENRFLGAHNTYLTLGAELGMMGLAAGAALALLALQGMCASSLNSSQKAALAALAGIAAHMAVDNYPSVNWAFLVALYVAYVTYEAELFPKGRVLQLAGALAALLLTGWTIQMFQYDWAQVLYEVALETGRYYDAYEALLMDPDNALYGLEVKRLGGERVSVDPMYALTMYGRTYK